MSSDPSDPAARLAGRVWGHLVGDAIPVDWLAEIRGREAATPLVDRLLAREVEE